MASAWMNHVKAVKKQNPKKSLKEVLKMAAKSYKKDGASKKKVGKVVKTERKAKGNKKKTNNGKTATKGKTGKKSRGRK